jgi:hypothetical protein
MELIAVIDGDSPWKTEQQACHKVVKLALPLEKLFWKIDEACFAGARSKMLSI